METIKSLLSSGGIGLLTDECASVYLDSFDLLNIDCAKATISKVLFKEEKTWRENLLQALGLGIIAGSIMVKLPIIFNMMKAKSAAGLSFTSQALELFPCATIMGYALANGFPFSAWGESLFMAAQTLFIAFLICSYNGETAKGVSFSATYLGLLFVLVQGFSIF